MKNRKRYPPQDFYLHLPSPVDLLPEASTKEALGALLAYDAAIKHAIEIGDRLRSNGEIYGDMQRSLREAKLRESVDNPYSDEAQETLKVQWAVLDVMRAENLTFKRAERAIYTAWSEYERASRKGVLEVPKAPSLYTGPKPLVQATTPGGPPPVMLKGSPPPEMESKRKIVLTDPEMIAKLAELQERAELLYPLMTKRPRKK